MGTAGAARAGTTRGEKLAIAIVIAGAACAFTLRPAARLYEDRDVARYAQMALEMRHHDTLVPTLRGEPYHEAMPIAAWAPYAVSAVQGEVTPLAGRVMPALSAILTMVAVLALARRHGSTTLGLLAAGVTVANHVTYTYARQSRVDASLGLAVAASVAAFFHAVHGGRRRPWPGYVLAGLAAGAGVALKGPLAAALVAAAVLPWLALERRWREALAGGAIAAAACAAATAAWLVPYVRFLGPAEADAFLDQFIGRETFDKFLGEYGKVSPFWSYAVELTWNFAPWIVPAALAAWRVARAPAAARPIERLALSWALGPLVLLSVASGKHIRYLVPVMPALALLAAVEVERWAADPASAAWRRLAAIARAVASVCVAAGLASPIVLASFAGFSGYGAALGLAAAAGGAAALARLRRADLRGALLGTYVAAAAGIAFAFAAALPPPALARTRAPHLALAEALAPLVGLEEPLAVHDPTPWASGRLDPTVLALYMRRWVDRAHDPRTDAVVLAPNPLPDREIRARIDWVRIRGAPAETWVLLERPRPPGIPAR